MLVVGITGGSGSGKSYICKALCKLGYTIIDADQIAREVVRPGEEALKQIVSEFGDGVLNADGTLNRKTLADIVFSNEDALARLNKITHTHIAARIRALLCDRNARYIIDAPLLYEAGLDALCVKIIGVTADTSVRIARIVARDNLEMDAARKRLNSQHSIDTSLSKVDLLIDTTQNPSADAVAYKIDNFIRREIHENI